MSTKPASRASLSECHGISRLSNQPVLIAYAVKERNARQKATWTRIGAAWPHDKGAGLTVILDFLPVDKRIVLVELKADLPPLEPK